MYRKAGTLDDVLQEYESIVRMLWGKNPSGTEMSQYEEPSQNTIYQSPLKGDAQLVSRHHPGVPTKTHAAGHFGLDLKQPRGSKVYAIGPGVVARTGTGAKKGGNWVTTHHEDGKVSVYYAHLDSINVSPGDKVDNNTVIGTLGDTGNARYFPHLHYQVKVDGAWIDPLKINGKEVGSLSKV